MPAGFNAPDPTTGYLSRGPRVMVGRDLPEAVR
jgi:hypothetical protein